MEDRDLGKILVYPPQPKEFTVKIIARIMYPDDQYLEKISTVMVGGAGVTIESDEIRNSLILATLKVAPGASGGRFSITYENEDNPNHKGCNVRLLPVEFITPAGDPVKKPVDQPWTAGVAPVDGANEFTFNDASPGVLEINLKVKVSGIGAMPADIQNKFLFEIDAIGNSQMQWDAVNAGGKPSFNGDFMTAKVKFTGLPQNNSDFGKKMPRIKFDGNKVGEEDFEVFFAIDKNNPGRIANHPGGKLDVWNQATLGTKKSDVPNWYYYWRQLPEANGVNLAYGGPNIDGAVPAIVHWGYGNQIDKSLMLLGLDAYSQGKAYGVGEFRSGIDYFVDGILHESKHIDQVARADALLPTNGADSFRYGWSWNKPVHNHWKKGTDGEWGVKGNDDDGDGTIDNAKTIPPFEPGRGDDISLDHPQFVWWPNSWALPVPNNVFHPIESEVVNYADNNYNEHQNARRDWGNPGKNHQTIDKWND